MFRVIPIADPALTSVGLRWMVEEEQFDGTTRPFAYFEREDDARQIAETLNEHASVVAVVAAVAADDDDWSFDQRRPGVLTAKAQSEPWSPAWARGRTLGYLLGDSHMTDATRRQGRAPAPGVRLPGQRLGDRAGDRPHVARPPPEPHPGRRIPVQQPRPEGRMSRKPWEIPIQYDEPASGPAGEAGATPSRPTSATSDAVRAAGRRRRATREDLRVQRHGPASTTAGARTTRSSTARSPGASTASDADPIDYGRGPHDEDEFGVEDDDEE